MKPNWLIETDTFHEGNPEKLIDIIKSMGMEAKWCKYVPFDGDDYDHYYPSKSNVLVYGSLNLTRALLRKKKDWFPICWADHEQFCCRHYYTHYGQYLLQEKYAMYTLGEIKRKKIDIYEMFSDPRDPDQTIFIRPDNNYKSFTGNVVSYNKFDRWYSQNMQCYNLDPTQLCVVAKTQKIIDETRFVIADRKVISGSRYIKHIDGEARIVDEPTYSEDAKKYAEEIAASTEWQIHRIYCLDVCLTANGYRLTEIGSVNSCGLYGCDLKPIVEYASKIAEEEYEEFYK